MVEENPIKQTNRAENPSKQITINFSCPKPRLSSEISIQIPPNKRALSQIRCQVPPSKKPKKAESFEKEPKKCSKELVTGNYSILKARLLSASSHQRALPQIQRTLPYQCLLEKCLERFHNKGHLSKHIELYHPGYSQDLRPVPLQENELINFQNQTAASTPSSTKEVFKVFTDLVATSIASAIPQATVISNNTRTSTSSSSNEGSEDKFLPSLPRHPVQHDKLVASGFSKDLETSELAEKEVIFKASTALMRTKSPLTTSIALAIPQSTVVIPNNTRASTSSSSNEGSKNEFFLPLLPKHPVQHEKLVASGCLPKLMSWTYLPRNHSSISPGHIQDLTPVSLQEDELISLQNQTSASTPRSTEVVCKASAKLGDTTMRTKSPLTTSIASAIPQATIAIGTESIDCEIFQQEDNSVKSETIEIKREVKNEIKLENFEEFEAREQVGIDFITSNDFSNQNHQPDCHSKYLKSDITVKEEQDNGGFKDFFCDLCKLQFDKKYVYDVHIKLVHPNTN